MWDEALSDKKLAEFHEIFEIFKARFLADRTIGRAFGTLCRLSVVCLSVCDVLYCGKMVRLS